MILKKGLVYLFEGDGKGKTSASLGVALRTILNRGKVVWISWYKCEDWKLSEMQLDKHFAEYIDMYWVGKGFFIEHGERSTLFGKEVRSVKTNNVLAFDRASLKEHLDASKRGIDLAFNLLVTLKPELLVLDEVVRAVSDGLIRERDLMDVVNARNKTHVILTGHKASDGLRNVADLITDMRKVKHPYDKGMLAVKGLDY